MVTGQGLVRAMCIGVSECPADVLELLDGRPLDSSADWLR